MKLKDILPLNNEKFYGDGETEISGVSYDSRKVKKGFLFFALPGHQTDGKKYIRDAIANGAVVIVSDAYDKDIKVAQIESGDVFGFMSLFCAKFFNYPDRELTILGITGTNGKTTVTYMIESILANLGVSCGVIGTVNYRYGGKVIEASNTTPQSLDVYKMMREMSDGGVKHLAMEVSSHALSLGRVGGIDFDTAVFTNLTQDHLDFHKTMENYFQAKASLFKSLGVGKKNNTKFAIINVDDDYGIRLSKMSLNAEIKSYSAAAENKSDFHAENIFISASGSKFDALYNGQTQNISIKHIGLHNVHNALASLAAVVCLGYSFDKTAAALSASTQAPGRLERVDTKNLGFEVAVDYAHTEDALKNVLAAIKNLNPQRIITVFGAGGDRDRTKRPLMGKTATEMSDFVFVTSDNPRTEDPEKIILDIEVGIKKAGKKNYKVVVDREQAIKEAVVMAEKGDVVLIAGKGHETYQIIGTQKTHFNDAEIALKYIIVKEKQRLQARQLGQKEFGF
ncbi:UDP-N-acetylmuramoyl-L-alanyl-D-glutamate--2,6-diaminopimelate ligase [Endomicrobium proavitum]|uniref:UDP-N-acetylmuramoyl-L-alanyl-D-glutamate--2,6-diaminopimelate ligase n=1 Tax=Endomicrobium proavitum TaxID=1408281 RepID=A0A0G3WIG1_9BACT|nr:UDP-N-acetylmuramoyl-L-alanyl-D-glutamate--2,6-diaminopimelate ligase [Endomicrobium proavitum]AKL97675.1 UDP-N-acetylmuramoyl-L-alanyl-D-glutamate--2,6-diaminopimelate ligase 1 [Endomicrobium proavitum]